MTFIVKNVLHLTTGLRMRPTYNPRMVDFDTVPHNSYIWEVDMSGGVTCYTPSTKVFFKWVNLMKLGSGSYFSLKI